MAIRGNDIDGLKVIERTIPVTTDFPTDVAGLSRALVDQRQYTLDLYAGIPQKYWDPAQFPYLKTVNPPLWELAHIAWFAEFFCLRWRPDDVTGLHTPSCMPGSDRLFDSASVPHAERWSNRYPSREACFDYMKRSLEAVLSALEASDDFGRYAFQLAVAHEDMHAEALAMTLNVLGLPAAATTPLPICLGAVAGDIHFEQGRAMLGESGRAFQFDNEKPALSICVAPFSIASQAVSAAEFAAFHRSRDYRDDRLWSADGAVWRRGEPRCEVVDAANLPAMHVNLFQAEAWCRWADRRLPTEAEWEYAATRSEEFFASTGRVWEWTASPFAGYPGFEPGPYRDYSAPWFGNHRVLRGGSYLTSARLKYPQYRNFYTPERRDMFCGFRTCANTP